MSLCFVCFLIAAPAGVLARSMVTGAICHENLLCDQLDEDSEQRLELDGSRSFLSEGLDFLQAKAEMHTPSEKGTTEFQVKPGHMQLHRRREQTALVDGKRRQAEGRAKKVVADLEALLASSEPMVSSNLLDNLEALLQTSIGDPSVETPKEHVPTSTRGPSVETPKERVLKLAMIFLIAIASVLSTAWAAANYERNERGEFDPPWYHDAGCRAKVADSVAYCWLGLGIFFFTEVVVFTDAEHYLNTGDALYVTAQVITTVGYGDLTPYTSAGRAFMLLYCFGCLVVVSSLIQTRIGVYLDRFEHMLKAENAMDVVSRQMIFDVVQVLVAIGFGTVFFAYWPGEGKSVFDAFYMSTITLTTIGFGCITPVTDVGKVVSAIWMLIGVMFMGNLLVSISTFVHQHGKCIRSGAAARRVFDKIDQSHTGTINLAQFLGFDLIQTGLDEAAYDGALARFAEFDSNHDGTLDFKEFKEYALFEYS